VADETPAWLGSFVMFPDRPGDFDLKESLKNESVRKRLEIFAQQRTSKFTYDQKLVDAHHIHIRGDENYRILQHHYGLLSFVLSILITYLLNKNSAFAFFADPDMQSFYKRY
jgi:hypothetical protein